MIYLLAKYTLLFLLAALLGFVLGYWFSRRNIEDVTESFEDLRTASSRSDAEDWNRLWARLDALPAPKDTDLSEVFGRIDSVSSAVAALPKPDRVSLEPVEKRLDSLDASIKSIPKPEPVRLDSIESRLDGLEASVKAIPQPDRVSLEPVETRLASLDATVKAIPKPEPVRLDSIESRLDSLATSVKAIPEPERISLVPLEARLDNLEATVKAIPVPAAPEAVDLTPVTRKISALEQRVIDLPRPPAVDLAPIDRRLTAIEKKLASVGNRPVEQRKAKVEQRKARPARRSEPRILSAALYGSKDNLQSISGVGPKLEKLLNKNGVYYFWQVAEWSKKDIDVIDERLDVFKGRIERDNWVRQANRLKKEPGAARMPAEL